MKLKAAYETEVYISNGGYLCLRQSDPAGGDDSVVMLSEEQAKLVAKEIERLLRDGGWWEASEETEDK